MKWVTEKGLQAEIRLPHGRANSDDSAGHLDLAANWKTSGVILRSTKTICDPLFFITTICSSPPRYSRLILILHTWPPRPTPDSLAHLTLKRSPNRGGALPSLITPGGVHAWVQKDGLQRGKASVPLPRPQQKRPAKQPCKKHNKLGVHKTHLMRVELITILLSIYLLTTVELCWRPA